jgi:hypothetical protein
MKPIALLSALAATLLVAGAPAGRAAPDAPARLLAARHAILRSDYRAELFELRRLRALVQPLRADPAVGVLADYWSGFAEWRWAMNAFNCGTPTDSLRPALRTALTDFESALARDSTFADARAAAIMAAGWLTGMQTDPESLQAYGRLLQAHAKALGSSGADNPRVAWTRGLLKFYMPKENGGGADVAIPILETGLALCDTEVQADPLQPDWGRPELWMAISACRYYGATGQDSLALVEAREALRLVPDWVYVRDYLVPLLVARIDSTNAARGR